MSYLVAITLFHTALCFIAIGAGAVAVAGLCQGRRIWTGRFLALATAVSVTGYFFPFHGVTPAMIVGAIALGVIVVALAAYRHFHLEGVWARVYASALVASLYLLAFVTVAQAFQKIPVLHGLAPTQSEPPFAIAQIGVLIFFLIVGWRATSRFRASVSAGRPVMLK
ncbi:MULTISPECIES: hypothetical protein [unclassified Sphingomonas]|jgi:hypothetical protein|uniref:hypothetical protein n=1 Tax=unclassified Sphingomonas TaxID=196159 RepID=UPI000926B082|nr:MULTISPECIES: hypothetical protein [unclassified Sphingomonas]OJU18452.1 MAG: hypothetical protein BGN95_08200 [Sphingomonas sp. 66-10]